MLREAGNVGHATLLHEIQTSLGPEPWGPSLRHLTMSRREPRYRRGAAAAASEAQRPSARFSSRMRTARTAALSSEKISATCHRPKTSGRTAISPTTTEIIGVVDEAVRAAADERLAGQDDDPRRPARPERWQAPRCAPARQDEHRRARSRRSGGRARATTRRASHSGVHARRSADNGRARCSRAPCASRRRVLRFDSHSSPRRCSVTSARIDDVRGVTRLRAAARRR